MFCTDVSFKLLTLWDVHYGNGASTDNVTDNILLDVVLGKPSEYWKNTQNGLARFYVGDLVAQGVVGTPEIRSAVVELMIELLLLVVRPFHLEHAGRVRVGTSRWNDRHSCKLNGRMAFD